MPIMKEELLTLSRQEGSDTSNPQHTIINRDNPLVKHVTFDLENNTTALDRYIVGFNFFDFNYRENHHISNLQLKLEPQLINNDRTIDVTVTMQMNDHSGHSLHEGTVNVVLVYYPTNEVMPQPNDANTVKLVSMTEFNVSYEEGTDHHLMSLYAYTDGSNDNDNHYNRAYIEDDSNHTGIGTTCGMTLCVDKAFFDRNRKLFINHFNLGHYKCDGHILQLSIDGRQDEDNNLRYAMSDGAHFNAQYCECRMSTLGNADWMSRIANHIRLSDLILPASHDAGMSVCRNISPRILGAYHMKTQDYPIYGQLMCGCRYFDIRVDKQNNELVTYHRAWSLGCDGESIQEVFDQAEHFLTRFPSEAIIIKISHIRGNSVTLANDTIDFLHDRNHLFNTHEDNVDLHNIPLANLAGRILVVCDFDGISGLVNPINSQNGIFCYRDVDINENGNENNQLRVYDKYSNENNYNTMHNDQIQKWNRFHHDQNNNHNNHYWFLLSWTLTQSLRSIKNGAATANRALDTVLNDRIHVHGYAKPNLVYLDFINTNLCNTVINYNNPNYAHVFIETDFQ